MKVYLKDNMDLALQLAKDKYNKRLFDNSINFPFKYVENALKEYQELHYNIQTGEVKKGSAFISGYTNPIDIPKPEEQTMNDIISYQFLNIIFSAASSRHYNN